MKLLEIQAKKVLQSFNIPVPPNGGSVFKSGETGRALKKAGGSPWILKAQVLTGGRGKAGGIKMAKTSAQAKKIVSEMLGMKLVTAQTGPEGVLVREVLVEKPVGIKREIYFSAAIDRRSGRVVLIASSEGGMEIEAIAREFPEKIVKIPIHSPMGLEENQARELLFKLSLYDSDSKKVRSRIHFFQNCVKAFLGSDASLLEINPLALSSKGDLIALDAKMTVDDNALFRHPELKKLEENADTSRMEREARRVGISYIPLHGSIGCMINGAGLAMATMDLIKQYGGEPANFLDVGGGANVEQVKTAFKIILSDKNVRSIFVNIFGGIMRCDVIAEGIVSAVKQIQLKTPLVVRLEGNRKEAGAEILSAARLNIVSINDLAQAAEKAVDLSKGPS